MNTPSPTDDRTNPGTAAMQRGGIRRRITVVALTCATAAGFVAAAAGPAQAQPDGGPSLYFTRYFTSPGAASLNVTDSVPSLSALNMNFAAQVTASNLSGVPISVYSGANYTGSCTTYTPTSNTQYFTIGGPTVFPRSVAINLTCGQWPGTIYGTPITVNAIGTKTDSTNEQPEPQLEPSSEVLDVPGATRDMGARTETWTKNGGDNQRWFLKKVDTIAATIPNTTGQLNPASLTAYKLISVIGNDYANARCLEAAGANPQVGAVVETYACDPNAKNQPNQLWLTASDQRTPSQDSFPDWAGARTANPQAYVNEYMNTWAFQPHADASATNMSSEWFNAAMLFGTNPANYPALTESTMGGATDGATLTMQNQAPGAVALLQQSWWIQPIGSTNACIGLYTTCRSTAY